MDIKKKVSPARKRLSNRVKAFPDAPGVYLMKDQRGVILYVGKASSLRKRVGSYYQKPPTDKVQALLSRLRDIEYIQTSSPAQALLLENSLIKKYKPYYNAALKDDKSYPYIKVVENQQYPYILIGRGKKEKTAKYYGPYISARQLKEALRSIREIFPFRSCKNLPQKPCLYLQLRLCPGMCVRDVDVTEYRRTIKQLGLFLQGRYNELFRELKQRMHQASRDEQFEEAASLRDRINSLNEIVFQTKEIDRKDDIFQLKEALQLKKMPYRIEAFDISEISGVGLCGSMVSFVEGLADKNTYRRFRIKTVKGVDDYAMIREVVHRRYRREPQATVLPLPDLVLVDGGKGQWSSARRELDKLGLTAIPVVSLAKRLETIFSPGGKAVRLPHESKALHLLQKIRDEAHRFAISYHRALRGKSMRISELDNIPGVGPKRKRILLKHFKSILALRQASLEDLLAVEGIDKKTAGNIIKHLRKPQP
ncbi:MAG: excinuclease ABC subunit UvrC [Candidatus Omnitrophica bacterium]|nr:excinuclease ABC subunit UvrC [Candidatus Omnitrophota bacterium]